MIYPSNFETKIGFTEIREQIKHYCQLPDSREKVDSMAFSTNICHISNQLKCTDEFRRSLEQLKDSLKIPFHNIPDDNLQRLLTKLQLEGSYLLPGEFLSILKILRCAHNLYGFFTDPEGESSNLYPSLTEIARRLVPSDSLIRQIETVFDNDGEIKRGASRALDEVRSHLRSVQGSINSIIGRVVKSAIANGIIESDATPVIRDGRLVLPVIAMNKRAINGIVHGESATGRTVYIEPAEVVENNNLIKELESQEQRLIIELLTQLTDKIRVESDVLKNNASVIVTFDFIRAKSRYALEIDGQLPHLSKKPELEWYHAVHPLLLKHLRSLNKEVVPLDITLTPKDRILIISGPNAGGKSVTLKTVGIVQYMMQCGVLPPLYSNSHMGLFRDIFIDIGDEQSMDNDLSTYSSHIRNMKSIVSACNRGSLVLIDEFGSGTEPLIGGAIAEAILMKLNEDKAWGVITTHYQNLKQAAESTPGLINGSMLYDRHLMQPLFMLSIGSAGSSFALEIARKSGLPESIIQKATEIVGQEYVDTDKYLLDINRDRKYWEKKRYDIKVKEKRLDDLIKKWEDDAEDLRKKRKTFIDEARKKADDLIKDANKNIENTIRGIKESNAEREKTKDLRTELENFRKKIQAEYLEEKELASRKPKGAKSKKAKEKSAPSAVSAVHAAPAVGSLVRIDGAGETGEVIEITGKKASVNFGMAKLTIDLDRLQTTTAPGAKNQKVRIASVVGNAANEQQSNRRAKFRSEIDVRGMRVDEALQAVTYFIDDAIQFSVDRVRILHGTGTGALRQAIRDYLKSLGKTLHFADEDVRLGGAGITVVTFK